MIELKYGHAYKVYAKGRYTGTIKSAEPGKFILRLIGLDLDVVNGSEQEVMRVLYSSYGDDFEVKEVFASTRIFSQD